MAKINHSATLEIGGKLDGSWRGAVSGITSSTDKIKGRIKGLRDAQKGVAQSLRQTESAASSAGVHGSAAVKRLTLESKKLKGQQRAVEAELRKAQRAAAKLGKDGSDDVDRLLGVSAKLEAQERDVVTQLDKARKSAALLGQAGSHDVAKLRHEHERLNDSLDREARRLKRIKRLHDFDVGGKLSGAIRGVGGNLASLGRSALFAGTAIGAIGLGALGAFTAGAIKTTAELERMGLALETVEGSQAKAQKSLAWITKFSDVTPFHLREVGEAYTHLRLFGIDPMDGSLKTLGDTAAAQGKDMMESVRAITGAMTGETERLKAFGISTKQAGNKMTFSYLKAGKTVTETVDKRSKAAVQATLLAIWNDKYDGAMKKQATSWNGLVSTISTKWDLFQARVMQAGVFDVLKGELSGFIDQANEWADDGTLERWAHDIAGAYKRAFGKLKEGAEWVRANWPEIKDQIGKTWEASKKLAGELMRLGGWLVDTAAWARDAAGGADNLAIGLGALGAAKVLSPLGSLVGLGAQLAGWLLKSETAAGGLSASLGKVGGIKGLGGFAGKAGLVGAAGLIGYEGMSAAMRATGADKRWERRGERAGRSDGFNDFVEGVGRNLGIDSLVEAARGNRQVNQTLHVNVEAKGADAAEVARAVSRELSDAMRAEAAAAHG